MDEEVYQWFGVLIADVILVSGVEVIKPLKHGTGGQRMSRLIDADALIADCQLAQKQADRHGREFANAFYSGGGEISTEWWCVEDMIDNAPTIEERKTGSWIYEHNEDGWKIWYKCSECGKSFSYAGNYCPECGAKMRGKR